MKRGDIVIALKDVKRTNFRKIEHKKGDEIIVCNCSDTRVWFKADGRGNFSKKDFILKSEYKPKNVEPNYEIY